MKCLIKLAPVMFVCMMQGASAYGTELEEFLYTSRQFRLCDAMNVGYAKLAGELDKEIKATAKHSDLVERSLLDKEEKWFGHWSAIEKKALRTAREYLDGDKSDIPASNKLLNVALVNCKKALSYLKKLISVRIQIMKKDWRYRKKQSSPL